MSKVKLPEVEDLNNHLDEINAILKDLYTLPKYRLINALISLSGDFIDVCAEPCENENTRHFAALRITGEALEATANEPEYFPTCLKGNNKQPPLFVIGKEAIA